MTRHDASRCAAAFAAAFVFSVTIGPLAHAATPFEEMTSFSAIQNIDFAKLAKGEVQNTRNANIGWDRGMAVQTSYVVRASLAETVQASSTWDSSRQGGSKVYLHTDFGSPGEAAFAKLSSAPNNKAIRNLATLTEALSSGPSSMLNLSDEEAGWFKAGGSGEPLPSNVVAFWTQVLASRSRAFASGGVGALPAYEGGSRAIRPAEEFNALLKGQPKVARQFSGIIANSGLRGGGKPQMYWELLDVEGAGSLVLGAFYTGKVSDTSVQTLDVQYYVSTGYNALITLQQLWAIDIDGQPATLVWRGDLISSSSLDGLRGMERLASGTAMFKEIQKTVNVFKKSVSR